MAIRRLAGERMMAIKLGSFGMLILVASGGLVQP
jgi:hypothetical protein